MRRYTLKISFLLEMLSLCLILSTSVAFGQCGADGKQPCETNSRTTTQKIARQKTKLGKNTKNSSTNKKLQVDKSKSSNKNNDPQNFRRNQNYGFIVMYKNSLKIQKTANQIRETLVKLGFNQEQFSYTSRPDLLYMYDRKAHNSYLSFDSSVPLEIREEVTKLIREVLPDVHIEIVEKTANNYFLLWIL